MFRGNQHQFERLESRQLLSATQSVTVGSTLYSIDGSNLYRSNLDGSNQSLVMHWNYGGPSQLFAGPNKLFFVAPSSPTFSLAGAEPWVSDDSGGVHVLADLYEGSQSSNPNSFHLVNGHVVFLADRNTHGNTQLYSTDGNNIFEISPEHQHGYYGAVANVDFQPGNVSFDYSSSWLQQSDHLVSDGSTNYYAAYSTPRTSTLTLSAGLSNGSLQVTRDANYYIVTGLWTTFRYPISKVAAIDLTDGGITNDTLTVDPAITVPVTFHDIGGNDTLTGGGGANTLILSNRNNNQPVPNNVNYNATVKLTLSGGTFGFSNGDQSVLHGIFTNVQTSIGNDTIIGTSRNETLISTDGNDSIVGGGGNDSLVGGNDDDTLIGSLGRDTLDAGWGNDSLNGGGGPDTLIDPTLPAGVTLVNGLLTIGNATTNGGSSTRASTAGDDLNIGFNGQFFQTRRSAVTGIVLNGSDQADNFSIDAIGIPATINCGAGDDSLSYTYDGHLRVYGGEGNDTLGAFGDDQYVDGGDGDDTIMTGDGNDTLIGGEGNDKLLASRGHNLLEGGAGNDYLSGYVGTATPDNLDYGLNTLRGGDGDDIIFSNNHADSIDPGTGDDLVTHITPQGQIDTTWQDGGDGGGSGDTTGSGGSGDTTGGSDSNDGGNNSTGDSGAGSTGGGNSGGDTNSGGGSSGGTTTTTTPDSPSWYSLKNGVLTLTGTAKADKVLLSYHKANGKLFVTFNGTIVQFVASRVSSIVVNGGAGNDQIDATYANVGAKIYGGAGSDLINGSLFADRIYGGDDADYLYAGGGNDTVYGEAGNDRVFGGAGLDHLDGGAGTNVLRGEDGKDTLTYRKGDNVAANKGDYLLLAPSLA